MGRTELRPKALGLGGAWWGAGTEAECIAGIHRALELGIDFFDTYPGEFEERWGRALAGRRDRVYLQGKVSYLTKRPSDHSGPATRSSVEASLKALQTDYLEVVLIHGYDQLEDVETRTDMKDPLGPGNALDELIKMKKAGMVRHIGIGARAADVHRRAIETGEIEVVLTYLEYNLLTQAIADTTLPLAKEHDVGMILASPLAMGLLTGDIEHAKRAAADPKKADDPEGAFARHDGGQGAGHDGVVPGAKARHPPTRAAILSGSAHRRHRAAGAG